MKISTRAVLFLLIFSFLFCCFVASTVSAQVMTTQEQSLELFRTGVQYFDEGIDASNMYNYNEAKKYMRLALSIFLSSRTLDPSNSYSKGFIYLTKGFMYQLSGTQMRSAIRTDSDPYTVLVQLRRAYYPLKHAQYYYDLSLEYLTDPDTRKYVEAMRDRNNEEVKLVKRFLPQVDYKADRFMNTIEAEASGIVNFDKINDMITEKNYVSMADAIKKNQKISKKLEKLKSDNASGFSNLTKAYESLIPVLESLDKSDEWIRGNQAVLGERINASVEDTRLAEAGFRDMALSNLCGNLRDNAIKIRSELRKKSGVEI